VQVAKILVAEDERDIRDLIEFTLKFGGYEVLTVPNGQAAVDQVANIMPDLIVLDIRMPKLNGYEACRAIKAIPEVANIPIVFLSAYGQDAEVESGFEAGAFEYIVKPFAPDQLTQRIQEILTKFGIAK
jgi:CheY-like chemotaxis protein